MQHLFLESLKEIKILIDDEKYDLYSAKKLQKVLMTMCLYCIGGQRRQFVGEISLLVRKKKIKFS